VSRHDPFFWDTVQLGSKHAHFFFENGLQWQPLPTGIDSGHPPVFGYYLAVIWTVFGKTLVASHFAMLPFLLLNVLLLWKIGGRLAGNTWGMALPLLVFLDPVLLGQSVMISPDVVLVASFLLALEGIFGQKKWLVLFGILGLCAISMRGMMTATALLTWAVLLPFLKDFQFRKRLVTGLLFLPGFAFSAWFLWWHWKATGWIGYHDDSPWAGAFSRVPLTGFLKNIAIVGWRWLDFGRVGELILLGWLFYVQVIRKDQRARMHSGAEYPVLSLLICLLVFLLPSALLYQNLSAHRYFLPAFVAGHLLVLQWLAGTGTVHRMEHVVAGTPTPKVIALSASIKKMLLGFVLLCLATGNCWVYPRGISMDWDSTLAHWPYHGLRQEAVLFLESNNIDFAEVGSAFPNLNTGENLLLNGDQRQFSKKDFALNQYIMASNVFNDFSEADYGILSAEWRLIWQKKTSGVWIEIYAKK
jgi:hypothetical protein